MIFETSKFQDFVVNAKIKFIEGYESSEQAILQSGLYQILPWEKNRGDSMEISSIDGEQYAGRVSDNGKFDFREFQQGYTKTMYLYSYGHKTGITKRMRERVHSGNRLNIVKSLFQNGKTPINRRELELTQRISNAKSTSYINKSGETIDNTTGDNLSFGNVAHTLKGSADTFSNLVAADPTFSADNYELAIQTYNENCKNEFGQSIPPEDNLVVYYNSLDITTENEIKRLFQSLGYVKSEYSSGVTNVFKGKKYVGLPKLALDVNGIYQAAKRSYWGIFSPNNTGLYYASENDIEYNVFEEDETRTWYSTSETSFGHVAVTGKNIVMSFPTP